MKHIYLLLSIGLLGATSLHASDPFSDLDNEMVLYEPDSANSAILEKEFQQYISTQEKEYKAWRSQYLKEFDQFQNEVVNKWGEGELSQKERSVEFSEDKNVKSIIDYENGQVTVAVLVDKNLSQADAEKTVQAKITQLLADKKSNIARLFDDGEFIKQGGVVIQEVQFSDVNKQQVKDQIVKQTQAQAQEIDKQADRAQLPESGLSESESQLLAAQEKAQLLISTKTRLNNAVENYEQAEKSAPKDKKVALYKVKLPKNSLAKRAEKYLGFAEKESRIRDIPAALVMAIMHSESAFDPRAKSPVPAYGLMQIVPTTAGLDVNRFLHHIDKPMNKNDLYVPAFNVQTGTAYLDLLDKRYLKAIKNDNSRLYCTIAAYNTGAGNVARAFNNNGSRNIKQAAIKINKLSEKQVYQQLITKLPYAETKHYLQRVHSRIALYQSKG